MAARGRTSMRRILVIASAAAVASALWVSPAAAQGSNFAMAGGPEPNKPTAGWIFTPSLAYQGAYDDNVLLRGVGDQAPSDFTNVINPRGDLTYQGRRTLFDTVYDGGFAFYRQLNELDSYDQHLRVSVRRLMTPHLAFFAQNGFAKVPTTELVNLIAVPFIRHGSKIDDLRGGVDAAISKRTSLTAAYYVEWISFDSKDGVVNPFLVGGHSQGGTLAVKHALSETTSLTGNYDVQHALVTTGATFDVQNADAGIEQRLSGLTRIFASFGFSRLALSEQGPARTGPAWRAGLSHQFEAASVDVSYSRSFVPAFGFGGTYQNEEFR